MAKPKFPSEEDRLLTGGQVAKWLGVDQKTVYRWAKDGFFPKPVVLGDPDNPNAPVRYHKKEIDDWLEARPRNKGPNAKAEVFSANRRQP